VSLPVFIGALDLTVVSAVLPQVVFDLEIPLQTGLDDAAWVILIDAMQSDSPPGRIRRFDRKDWPTYSHGLSSHGFGVLGALALAGELGSLPPRLDLYGIEIGSANPGEQARGEILAAAQQLARHIAADLAATLLQA
jgi:hydrogenase maturation protease